jgi:hypothetical protein
MVTAAVRRSDGTHVATSKYGTHVAALRAFAVVETVSGRTGTASVTYTGNVSKAQTLAQSRQAGADVTAIFTRLAVAAGMSESDAASVLGPDVGQAVGRVTRESRPETETAYHQHSRTNGNRYLDWSPYTARPSLSGCGSSTIGLTETKSGAGYSQTETYCDGQILPWVRVGTTTLDPYAGSSFQCRYTVGHCNTSDGIGYGQKSDGYLHSPPAASYSSGHTLQWRWVNQWVG